MNKYDFLLALEERLAGLPEADLKASLDYYSEILDDLTESGMTEQDAVASLSSVDTIAQQILLDIPLPRLVKAKMKKRRMSGLEITLLIVGFPIWLPILISLFAVVLSVYISLWAVVVSLYASDLAIAVTAPASILAAVILFVRGQPAVALLFIGAALVCGGLAILLFLGCNAAAKGMVLLGKLTLRGIKACFIGRGDQ